MNQISSLRSLLENTQAGLDLLMEMDDVQLDIRDRAADLTSALQQEREAADELIEGLREFHLNNRTRGMGRKGQWKHLHALVDAFDEAREEWTAMLAKGGDARAEARVASVVEDIVPPSEEEEEEEEEEVVPSLADVLAENIDGSFTPEDKKPDLTARVASQHDSVRGLGLRKHAIAALEQANIYSIGQLIRQTPDYLLSLHQFGAASMDDVRIGLDALDFEWPNGRLFGAGETPLGRLIRGADLRQTEEEEDRKEEEERTRLDKEKEIRLHKAAVARQYYRKNRKKILKQQSVYRQRTRVRIQDLEAKANERGDQ